MQLAKKYLSGSSQSHNQSMSVTSLVKPNLSLRDEQIYIYTIYIVFVAVVAGNSELSQIMSFREYE